ncbi:unnamed protein product [Clavelina lepadiformis]|uniref:tetrahydrofolate synthase n=1 Tax=Clavelina lepadiformis TaxID=159417 RepID=A0ABP0F0Z3_CLALP
MSSHFFRSVPKLYNRKQHALAHRKPLYKDAVKSLMGFQKWEIYEGIKFDYNGTRIMLMKELLRNIDVTEKDLNKMNVIHVAGSKGKGSTCTFVESILQHHGVRTGLLTSPHVIENRERFHIDGKPISAELFGNYFWEVCDRLGKFDNLQDVVPSYFWFLNMLGFYIFKHEKVDAVILEVGIGGAYDSTNVVNQPTVCGITSLALEHTDDLGKSMKMIAWHKAGILKRNAPAFVVPQTPECMSVIQRKAEEVGTVVKVVPSLTDYWNDDDLIDLKLGLPGEHQTTNASLALQLSHYWLSRHQNDTGNRQELTYFNLQGSNSHALPFHISKLAKKALSSERHLLGRAEKIKCGSVTFYFDGAHTAESIKLAANWFREEAEKEAALLDVPCEKVLVFNVSGERDATSFLKLLQPINFSGAIFTTNDTSLKKNLFLDETIRPDNCSEEEEFRKIHQNLNVWKSMCGGNPTTVENSHVFSSAADALCWLSSHLDEDTFNRIAPLASSEQIKASSFHGKHVQVFVTGSFRLVGAYLRLLDFEQHN